MATVSFNPPQGLSKKAAILLAQNKSIKWFGHSVENMDAASLAKINNEDDDLPFIIVILAIITLGIGLFIYYIIKPENTNQKSISTLQRRVNILKQTAKSGIITGIFGVVTGERNQFELGSSSTQSCVSNSIFFLKNRKESSTKESTKESKQINSDVMEEILQKGKNLHMLISPNDSSIFLSEIFSETKGEIAYKIKKEGETISYAETTYGNEDFVNIKEFLLEKLQGNTNTNEYFLIIRGGNCMAIYKEGSQYFYYNSHGAEGSTPAYLVGYNSFDDLFNNLGILTDFTGQTSTVNICHLKDSFNEEIDIITELKALIDSSNVDELLGRLKILPDNISLIALEYANKKNLAITSNILGIVIAKSFYMANNGNTSFLNELLTRYPELSMDLFYRAQNLKENVKIIILTKIVSLANYSKSFQDLQKILDDNSGNTAFRDLVLSIALEKEDSNVTDFLNKY